MFQAFTWIVWLIFFCLFLMASLRGDQAMTTFAFSGECLIYGVWLGSWIWRRIEKRKEL